MDFTGKDGVDPASGANGSGTPVPPSIFTLKQGYPSPLLQVGSPLAQENSAARPRSRSSSAVPQTGRGLFPVTPLPRE